MIVAIDVLYSNGMSHVAALAFNDWNSEEVKSRYSLSVECYSEYIAGQFYLREMRPILAILEQLTDEVEILVIDGYCYLDASERKGLGAHLYGAIDEKCPIIGVAKNPYQGSPHAVHLLRGESKKPLFITAVGISQQKASEYIAQMAGSFRIPTLLKEVDAMSREHR